MDLVLKYLPDAGDEAKKGRSRWWLGMHPTTRVVFPPVERMMELAEKHLAHDQFECIDTQENHMLFRLNTKSSPKARENFRRAVEKNCSSNIRP